MISFTANSFASSSTHLGPRVHILVEYMLELLLMNPDE